MARVVLVFEDGEAEGDLSVSVDSGMEIKPGDQMTLAQKSALAAVEWVGDMRRVGGVFEAYCRQAADRIRLLELRENLRKLGPHILPPYPPEMIAIQEEMGKITRNYSEHDELLQDWDEYCECSECMDE